ncbi:hypothetical protein, partial [Pandoraea sputorum]|uniref:hypothetical protein n=1 Tax=Pandoraea sputorum TaxID=93222 RepID=UPI003556C86C
MLKQHNYGRYLPVLASAASLPILTALLVPFAQAGGDSQTTLERVTVAGAAVSDVHKERKRLQKVAGNTAVVDNRQVEQ